MRENFRYQIPVSALVNQLPIGVYWNSFFKHVTPQYFRDECSKFFTDYLLSYYGEDFLRFFSEADIGYRGIDDTPLLFDFQIGINSPSRSSSSVRGIHLDNPVEVIALLLYFPEKNYKDSSLLINRSCGEIEKYGKLEFLGDFEITASVPYHQNHGAIFLNTIESFHSVEQRLPCDVSRKLLNIIIEVNPRYHKPLFTISQIYSKARSKVKKNGFNHIFRKIFSK
jgi:hypothetical protein